MVFMALCTGCTDTPIVTRSELDQLKATWKEPKVSIWYYVGTKDGCNYFTHWDVDGRKTYRISDNEQKMENPFTVTTDEKAWRVMYWGVQAKGKPKDREWEPNQRLERTGVPPAAQP